MSVEVNRITQSVEVPVAVGDDTFFRATVDITVEWPHPPRILVNASAVAMDTVLRALTQLEAKDDS